MFIYFIVLIYGSFYILFIKYTHGYAKKYLVFIFFFENIKK